MAAQSDQPVPRPRAGPATAASLLNGERPAIVATSSPLHVFGIRDYSLGPGGDRYDIGQQFCAKSTMKLLPRQIIRHAHRRQHRQLRRDGRGEGAQQAATKALGSPEPVHNNEIDAIADGLVDSLRGGGETSLV